MATPKSPGSPKKPSVKQTPSVDPIDNLIETPIETIEETPTETPTDISIDSNLVSGPTALEENTEDFAPGAAFETEVSAHAVESPETPLEAPVSDSNVVEVESTTEVIIPNPFSPQTFITVPRAGGFVGDKRAIYADQTGQIRSTRSY